MNALLVTVVAPLVGALIIPLLWRLSWAGWLNVLVSAVTLVASLNLAVIVAEHGVLANTLFRVDAFNVYLLALTAFVGLTTSIFSRPYMSHVCDSGRVSQRGMRLYHAMFQAFMFTMLLALSTDNLGVLWVSVEGATLATVLLVSLYLRLSRRHGNTLFSAVWALRWPCSARCCSILPPSMSSPTRRGG